MNDPADLRYTMLMFAVDADCKAIAEAVGRLGLEVLDSPERRPRLPETAPTTAGPVLTLCLVAPPRGAA